MSINNEKNDDWLITFTKDVKSIRTNVNNTIKDENLENLQGLSTRGSLSKQWGLTKILDKGIIEKIKSWIIPEYKKLFDVKDIELSFLSSWTVIGKKNSYHEVHNHIKGREKDYDNIGVVIYLESPEKTFHQSGDFYYLYEDKVSDYIRFGSIEPVEGTIIMMPSWLWHGAYPTSGKRQTLNLEFEIKEL